MINTPASHSGNHDLLVTAHRPERSGRLIFPYATPTARCGTDYCAAARAGHDAPVHRAATLPG